MSPLRRDGVRLALALTAAVSLLTILSVALVLPGVRAPLAPRPSPTREQCLTCHGDVRGLGPEHDPRTLGCSPCHLGDPTARDEALAHRGMIVLTGDLSTVGRTCGRAGCHVDEASRVNASLMAGAPGILAVDRFAFGERADPTPHPEDDLRALSPRALPRSPAEDHVRRLCASCHLGARKERVGDLGFDARGGGCTACHLAPPREGAVRPGSRLHYDVSSRVSEARCEGCHARSGRISLSYRGRVELEPGDPRATSRLPDGRPSGVVSMDVHARAGMTCVDCHTERDLMGDGRPHAFASDAVGVRCEDCHGPTRREHPPDPAAERVALQLRASWARHGLPAIPQDTRPVITRAGAPLWRTDRTRGVLWRAEDGARLSLTPARDGAHHALRGHERLTCQACHTVWAPRCGRCHTRYEPSGSDHDHLAGGPRPGHWTETAGANGFGPPLLALTGEGRIAPFVEGMTLTLSGLRAPTPTVQRTLWAPLDAHTTGPARACGSCHTTDLDAVYPPTGETTRPRARVLTTGERARVRSVARCVPCHTRYEDPVYRDFRASEARGSRGALRGVCELFSELRAR